MQLLLKGLMHHVYLHTTQMMNRLCQTRRWDPWLLFSSFQPNMHLNPPRGTLQIKSDDNLSKEMSNLGNHSLQQEPFLLSGEL